MEFKKNSAIALILTVGILAILALVAVGFSAFTRLELRATENYVNQLRAELIAEAGIAEAVSLLKYGDDAVDNRGTNGVRIDPYDKSNESWFYLGNSQGDGVAVDLDATNALYPSLDNLNGAIGDGISGEFAQGEYKLKIVDCASLININTPLPDADAENDFKELLKKLGLTDAVVQNAINYRKTLPSGIFLSKEELKLVSGIAVATYDNLKDFITLFGDEDDGIIFMDKASHAPVAGHTRKVFVNVNTAPRVVLEAVIKPIVDNNTLISDLIDYRNNNPFDGIDDNTGDGVFNFSSALGELHRFFENEKDQGVINDADLIKIKDETNPNRGSTSSTNFCFDSGGYYEIEAIGQYRGAKKRIKKVVHLYNKIYQTTKVEFDNLRSFARITTHDECPVDIRNYYAGYLYNYSADNLIADAVKLGFWDNFSDSVFSKTHWRIVGDCWFDIENGMLVTKALHSDGITEKVDANFPIITLGDETNSNDPWMLSDFYAIVHSEDETGIAPHNKHVDRIDFPWSSWPLGWNDPETYEVFAEPNPNGYYVERNKIFQEYMNTAQILYRRAPHAWRTEGTAYIAAHQLMKKFESTSDTTDDINVESGWVDLWNQEWNFGAGRWEWHYFSEMGNSTQFGNKLIIQSGDLFNVVSCGSQENKTLHLTVRGKMNPPVTDNNVIVTAYWDGGTQVLTHNNLWRLPEEGVVGLYGSENLPDFDNIRVIPEQGVYTSTAFNPPESAANGLIEWGTISAGVTLPDNAQADKEKVFLNSNFRDDVYALPGPNDLAPGSSISPSGGNIVAAGTYPYIIYRIYMFSGYNDSNSDLKDIPVVEDVTITYMPKTEIVYQNKI